MKIIDITLFYCEMTNCLFSVFHLSTNKVSIRYCHWFTCKSPVSLQAINALVRTFGIQMSVEICEIVNQNCCHALHMTFEFFFIAAFFLLTEKHLDLNTFLHHGHSNCQKALCSTAVKKSGVKKIKIFTYHVTVLISEQIFGIMIRPFSFCEISKTWGTNKQVNIHNHIWNHVTKMNKFCFIHFVVMSFLFCETYLYYFGLPGGGGV